MAVRIWLKQVANNRHSLSMVDRTSQRVVSHRPSSNLVQEVGLRAEDIAVTQGSKLQTHIVDLMGLNLNSLQ